MKKNMEDRRKRKTRSALQKELIELLKVKDIHSISVREISDRADINRGTFYLHYKDVYDMVSKIENELFNQFNQILDKNNECYNINDPYKLLLDIYTFLFERKELVQVLLGKHGDFNFLQRLKDLFKERIEFVWEINSIKKYNIIYYTSFITNSIMGLIDTWVNYDDEKSPEEMAKLSTHIIIQGIEIFTSDKN